MNLPAIIKTAFRCSVRTFVLLIFGLYALPAAAVYKCYDPDGNVIYQQEACEGKGRELPPADQTLSTYTPPEPVSDPADTSAAGAGLEQLTGQLGSAPPGGQPTPAQPAGQTAQLGGQPAPVGVQPPPAQLGGLGGLTQQQRDALQTSLPSSVSIEDVDQLMSQIQSGQTGALEGLIRQLMIKLAFLTLALIILSIPVGLLAVRWRRSFWSWFVLSLMISPFISILFLLARGKAPVPPNPEKEREALAKLAAELREMSNSPSAAKGQEE